MLAPWLPPLPAAINIINALGSPEIGCRAGAGGWPPARARQGGTARGGESACGVPSPGPLSPAAPWRGAPPGAASGNFELREQGASPGKQQVGDVWGFYAGGDVGTLGGCSPWSRLGWQKGAGQPELARLVFLSPCHAGGLPLTPRFAMGNAKKQPGIYIPAKPGIHPTHCGSREAPRVFAIGSGHRCPRGWGKPWGSSLPPAHPSGGAGLQLRGAPWPLSWGIARVRIRPHPAARPASAVRLGAVEARKGGREGEARGCTWWGLRRASSQHLQRGCVGLRASQYRAIRANLIKTDGPIGGLPPINPALALH